MDAERLKKLLQDNGDDFFDLRYLEVTDSTNEDIKRAAAMGAGEGLVYAAEEQTAGKGRSGRAWVSPSGEAAYFSFLIRPQVPPQNVSSVTLVMGLSVAQAVRVMTGLDVKIKWPNDVVINGKKICGILTEASASMGKIDYVVVGTGVNVNNRAFAEEISERATSLYLACGHEVDREKTVASILHTFAGNYQRFVKYGNLKELVRDYDELLISKGNEVRIEDPRGPYTARSKGIDEEGCLMVERADGSEERIACGEVSVRGLYGYV